MALVLAELQLILEGYPLLKIGSTDAITRSRLVEAGLIDINGLFTKKGESFGNELVIKNDQMRDGIILAGKRNVEKKTITGKGWITVTVTTKKYVTNHEIAFAGRNIDVEGIPKGSGDERKKFWHTMQRATSLKKKWVEVRVWALQGDGLFGQRWIWLVSKDFKLRVAVQAKYYDFMSNRFSEDEFLAHSPTGAVVIRPKRTPGTYYNGVGGFIAPF